MKPCRICGVEKPLTEFHRQERMMDGHINHCRSCCKEKQAAYYLANRKRILAHYRKVSMTAHFKERRKLRSATR